LHRLFHATAASGTSRKSSLSDTARSSKFCRSSDLGSISVDGEATARTPSSSVAIVITMAMALT
jgi:hypothetical protein